MKSKIWKIVSIINIIIIVFIVACLVIKFGKLNNNRELKPVSTIIDKSVTIDAGTYNQLFHIKQMINNFKVDDSYYTKLEIDIINNRDVGNFFNMNKYELVDIDNQVVASCYENGDIKSTVLLSDKMPNFTEANKTTSGYLYCDNNYKDAIKLKIRVIDYIIRNEDDSVDYKYVYYYIDLK